MPRFVLLDHDWPTPHLDLLVEWAGVLESWRLPAFPQAGVPLRIERRPLHRLDYLEYEGPVSQNRGRVQRRDGGECLWELRQVERWVIAFQGKQLRGRWQLRPVEEDDWEMLDDFDQESL